MSNMLFIAHGCSFLPTIAQLCANRVERSLELPRIGVPQASAHLQVGVVNNHVGVEDVLLVVVVVDDRDLVRGEALPHP